MLPATDPARARLAECRAILGGVHDPMAQSWADMGRDERHFWLRASRLPVSGADRAWAELSGDARTLIKNNLYRAAKRAELILRGNASAN